MEIKNLLDYELIDIGINIKCVIRSLNGKDIICFNCETKYEDTAEETISEIISGWLLIGGSLKDAINRQGCTIHKIGEY